MAFGLPNKGYFSTNSSFCQTTQPWRTCVKWRNEVREEDDKKVVLTLSFRKDNQGNQPYIRPFIESLMRNEQIRDVITAINKGFNIGLVPQAVKFGVSGSYFLRGPNRVDLAIFKPFDEEPFAPNNPKGYVGKFGTKAMRDGVLSGEGASREVAAFMLDTKGIHRVPETFFVELFHPHFDASVSPGPKDQIEKIIPFSPGALKNGVKYGSLQILKDKDGESCDYPRRRFAVDEVQAIAALDIRILNCDRNEGNILVKELDKDKLTIIPIDHALSIPDSLSICDYELCWSLWQQVELPVNEKLLEYILRLDTRQNVKMLKKYLRIRPICLRNFRIAETVLIKSVSKGLTLFDITKIMYKLDPDGPKSVLENIVLKTEEIYKVIKTSVNKSLYLRLNNIREKEDKDIITSRSAVQSKVPREFVPLRDEPKATVLNFLEIDSPTKKECLSATKNNSIFFGSSELDIKNALGTATSAISSCNRKRAQSLFGSEENTPEHGIVRLDPLVIDEDGVCLFPSPDDACLMRKSPLKATSNEDVANVKDQKSTNPSSAINNMNNESRNITPSIKVLSAFDGPCSAENLYKNTSPLALGRDKESEEAISSSTPKKLKRTISNPQLTVDKSASKSRDQSAEKKNTRKKEEGNPTLRS